MSISTSPTTSQTTFWLSPSLQGAYWKILSCACFAVINGLVRYLSGGAGSESLESLPVPIIMFFQNVFGTLFLLPWILKSGGLESLKTRYIMLHFIRVITAVVGVYLWYLSLRYIPISESVALNFTGPIFTVLGAWLLLKEKINFMRLLAIILSLTGAFIISRPDIALLGGNHPIGLIALLPLSSAIALAWNKLLTRKLAKLGETPTSIATYLLVLMVPVSFIPALYVWVTPNSSHWPWLIALGALASLAHFSFGKAYKLAEVTFLTPVGFTKFFLSTSVGYFAFAEFPTTWSLWVGMGIIFISILLLAYKIPLYSMANRLRSN